MELHQVPRILIITLKRFKQTRSRYGGMGFGDMGMFSGGEKLDTLVDFPLEGLDMSPYVRSESQRAQESLIYDCFAVSHHFGGTGGGHYTAYAKHRAMLPAQLSLWLDWVRLTHGGTVGRLSCPSLLAPWGSCRIVSW